MNRNRMTENVEEGSKVASVIGKSKLENLLNALKQNQKNEQTNLENQGENQGENGIVEKTETLNKTKKPLSKVDAEKGILLMMNGTDDEIREYFGNQGVELSEILKERDVFQKQIRETTYAEDLNELQKEFSFLTANRIQEIPNFEKFAKLRASGLSAIESFEGASGKLISMEYLKNRDEFSYSHLKSTGLKGSVSADIPIPKEEVAIWKSAFPNDTFTQLTKRYNKTKFN